MARNEVGQAIVIQNEQLFLFSLQDQTVLSIFTLIMEQSAQIHLSPL